MPVVEVSVILTETWPFLVRHAALGEAGRGGYQFWLMCFAAAHQPLYSAVLYPRVASLSPTIWGRPPAFASQMGEAGKETADLAPSGRLSARDVVAETTLPRPRIYGVFALELIPRHQETSLGCR